MYIPGPFQEHSHKQNYEQNCLAMYMYVYVHSRTIPGAFPQAKLRPELPCYMHVCICVCMYVSSYVDDAGELKSCKQSSIRKASKEFRQSNERCGRVALDHSIAKPAFEKFAKNHQIHKFFGPGCWPLAQNP